MTSVVDTTSIRIGDRIIAIGLGLVCAVLIAVGAVVEQQPIVAVAALLMVPAATFILLRPESAVPIVLFVLYSNAAVVAVRFHGVPSIAAMIVPAPLLIPLFYNIVMNRRSIVITPALPWILAFIAWQMVSAMLSRDPDKSVDGLVGTVLEGLVMYLFITNVVRTPNNLKAAVWSLVAAGAFMGSVSVYQQATGSFGSNLGGFGQVSGGRGFEVNQGLAVVRQRRLCGPIGEQNRYAQIMLMLVPLAISRFRTERQHALRGVAIGSAVLIGCGFALTFSRSGAIAFLLMLLVGVCLRFVSKRQVASVFLGGLILLVAIPQYRVRLATVPSALGIFGTSSIAAEQPDGAMRGRATEMLAAARMAIDHPLFGVGPDLSGTYTRQYGQVGGLRALEGARETHCLFLEIPAETGIPGLLLFLTILGVSIFTLMKDRQRVRGKNRELEHTVVGFLLALTGYLVMGLFLHMSYIRYFWLMLAMADACHYVVQSSPIDDDHPGLVEATV